MVGTYGRGFWILDDITPLQQLTPEVAASDVHLFDPRDAYRFHNITGSMNMPNDPSVGENPPRGASINYWLGSVPEGDVTIEIANAMGETIRTLEGSKKPGLNRVMWNLRDSSETQIKLRTKPQYADWVDLGERRWRSGGGGITILQPPGTYTVTLVVGGQEQSQQLTVLKDPTSEGSEADIRVQIAKVEQIREDYDAAAAIVNQAELIRRQLYDLTALLEDQGDAAEIIIAAEELDAEIIAVEETVMRLRGTGTGQDGVRWPTRIVGRLRYLAGTVATADFPPNDQQGEVHAVLRERLDQSRAAWTALLENELPAFNRMLQQRNLPRLISDQP